MLYRSLIHSALIIVLIIELAGIFSIRPVFAQNNDPTGSCKRLEDRFKAVNEGNFTDPKTLTEVFPKYCTVAVVVRSALNILFGLSGAAAVLFIVIGGFQYMASAGNQEIADKGKKTLTYAVIGLVVIILATTIVNIVVNLLVK